ncbi:MULTISPECIES: tol-pal system-associated acyl-CoA thioesterase [Acetobacter]|uniref:Tol-pal system-associated acyl-CoA thioesterase n=1 Tax=Acetobacter persici TaxID=1076596 RepID=A0A6V8I9C1_9PROT|nr:MULTISPECIES: tol-pal system-associated acyl-CoA thioesterase [Acetobacter]MBS0963530.1 tol-pal system-associated acyl-CoA thioesterase [Acetobacter persici]MBS1001709.1 tol-pal system-associated acyl-CoA thioesterase [Acetobacter persici]MBS1016422.1 tol-pal system-associated acyl-CoA thioesterase [Acetobacter persici]MCG0999270.1 tol-pal system-associated acyl-CoA thioesterase [Acetobacter persici]MCP9319239.1 tol-pal system-associated acyl-CoA thioesterase [Acetobacter persici]
MTTHAIDFRIYYEDTDAGGIVYHARYLAFAERARTEAIRSLGMPAASLLSDYGLVFVVHDATLNYRVPLRLDDVVTITTRLLEEGAASCRLEQIFTRGDVFCARVDVRLACVRAEDGRPARFPPLWRDLLRGLAAEV